MSVRGFHAVRPAGNSSLVNSKIIVDGNSLSNYGSPCYPGESYGSGAKWPDQMAALSPFNSNGATILNYATSGQTTLQMINGGALACYLGASGSTYRPAASLLIDPLFDSSKTCYLIFWEGGNDLQINGNVTNAYDRIVSYCNARRAAGFKVVVLTLIKWQWTGGPSTPFGDTWAQFDTKRLALNTMIRDNYTSFADGLCDVALNDAFDDPSDTTYYWDGIHLNGTGRGIIAGLVSSTLQTIP